MREYEPRYPFEFINRQYYPNLFKDSSNKVLSENITFFVLEEKNNANKVLGEMESTVRKNCRKAEVAYHDSFGNRGLFLVLNKNLNQPILRRMQAGYKKLH